MDDLKYLIGPYEIWMKFQISNFQANFRDWWMGSFYEIALNSSLLGQNDSYFAADIFQCISLNEKVRISIKISPNFVPEGPISNIPALVQIMARRRRGDKPLSEPMLTQFIDAYMRH